MNDDIGKSLPQRFPMTFGMRYVIADPTPAARHGAGETVWLSSKEVAFLSKGPAGVGEKIALYVEWPVLLQGEVPLQLIVTAVIVQRSGPLSVAKISRHEFRTRAVQSFAIPRLQAPVSVWATQPSRYIPIPRTPGGAPPQQPVAASLVGA
jgi:hypothetical protein